MTDKAKDSIAPSGNGVENTLTLVGTLDATARIFALPAGYRGNWIRVKPVGAAVRWIVRVVPQNTALPAAATVIDNATAVAADPPTGGTKIGSHVADGFEVERELPYADGGSVIWFAWQGLAVGTFLQIEKGSGKPAAPNEP